MLNIGSFARLGRVSPRTLRHYDQLGLLVPERIDPTTGYRYYAARQLTRLHQLLALRDLGFTLEQIGGLLDDQLAVDELRGMLRLRHAQIEESLSDERARLRRVEAHIRALERNLTMSTPNVVVKQTEPLRIAEVSERAPGFGPDNLGPVLGPLYGTVVDHLARAGIRPGISVAYYDEMEDDGSIRAHAGFAIDDQPVEPGAGVTVVELPVIDVASMIHEGSMETINASYEDLVRWIEDSGYSLAGYSRELYHEMTSPEAATNVTELQMPITK